MDVNDTRWVDLAPALAKERDATSFMALLLDQDLIRRVADTPAERILDFGAGTGALAFAVARDGSEVDAFEPTWSQFELLREAASARPSARVRALSREDQITGRYGLLLCVNVLDHIQDLDGVVKRLAAWTVPGGRLLLVMPHPLKDIGDWHRSPPDGDASSYLHYELHDYLAEGECLKNREDSGGHVIAHRVPSYHRTVSTYFNTVQRNGFDVVEMTEAAPDPAESAAHPILYAKSSRIPYFLLFDCFRSSVAPEPGLAG